VDYLELLKQQFSNQLAFKERRPGVLQLIAPLFHEDGDMVDIFIEKAGDGNGLVRVCDHGLTLMRLSYSYDVDTANKERILRRILSESGIGEENGNLFLDVEPASLYPAVLAFAQAVSRVTNMQQFKREVIQSLFYEMVDEFVQSSLRKYNPQPRIYPLPERDDLEVDYRFDIRPRPPVFLFASKDVTKTRLAAISCLEFQRHHIPHKSFIAHEDFDSLGRKDRARITSAADKQFISLDDFRDNAVQVFEREVA